MTKENTCAAPEDGLSFDFVLECEVGPALLVGIDSLLRVNVKLLGLAFLELSVLSVPALAFDPSSVFERSPVFGLPSWRSSMKWDARPSELEADPDTEVSFLMKSALILVFSDLILSLTFGGIFLDS